jgi:hypothetical protein
VPKKNSWTLRCVALRKTRIVELGTLVITGSIFPKGASAASYCFVSSLHILVTLMMELIHSSETLTLNKSHTAHHPRRGHFLRVQMVILEIPRK